MTELLSMREYARRRGVSAMAVSKAVKRGRVHLVDGKIDPAIADREWSTNTQPGQAAARAAHRASPGPGAGDPPGGESRDAGRSLPPLEGVLPGSGAGPVGAYGQARAIREGYLARLAKIDFEVRTGKLVPADQVRVAAFNLARRARDSLLSIPARIGPIVAGETDTLEIQRLLTEELRRVCEELAGAKPL